MQSVHFRHPPRRNGDGSGPSRGFPGSSGLQRTWYRERRRQITASTFGLTAASTEPTVTGIDSGSLPMRSVTTGGARASITCTRIGFPKGAAEYIGAYSEKTRFGDNFLYTSYYWPCPYYRTIEHLRADNPHYSVSQGSLCNYSLGESLFINLDRSMGHTAFTAGFRNLHQRLSTYEDDEIDQGLSLMNAFCPQCLSPIAGFSSAGYTLARWYGEMILTDTSAPTGTITGLGSPDDVSLDDQYGYNRQYGIPEVSGQQPGPAALAPAVFQQRHQPTGNSYGQSSTVPRGAVSLLLCLSRNGRCTSESDSPAWFYVYLGNPPRRAPGHHWVYVYNESGEDRRSRVSGDAVIDSRMLDCGRRALYHAGGQDGAAPLPVTLCRHALLSALVRLSSNAQPLSTVKTPRCNG